jgi:hypothetical protein
MWRRGYAQVAVPVGDAVVSGTLQLKGSAINAVKTPIAFAGTSVAGVDGTYTAPTAAGAYSLRVQVGAHRCLARARADVRLRRWMVLTYPARRSP